MNIRRKRQKESSLHLTDKKHPLIAILAFGVGIWSVIVFSGVCLFSSKSHGHGGLFVGFGGLFCLLLSMVGFGVAWYSLHQDNIRQLFPTLAVILNGLLMVFYISLYMVGSFI